MHRLLTLAATALVAATFAGCGGDVINTVQQGQDAVQNGKDKLQQGQDAVQQGREALADPQAKVNEVLSQQRQRLTGGYDALRTQTDAVLDCQVRACADAAVAKAQAELDASKKAAEKVRKGLPQGQCRSAIERYLQNLSDYGQTLAAVPAALSSNDPVASRAAEAALIAARAQLSPNTDPTLGAIVTTGECVLK